MDTPIVILNYKTYLESSGKKALDLAKDLESVASETGITMVASPQAADIYRIKQETSLPILLNILILSYLVDTLVPI